MQTAQTIAPNAEFSFDITSEDANTRLDKFLTKQFSLYSRNFFQQLIDKGHVFVNGKLCDKSSTPMQKQDHVTITFPPERSVTVPNEVARNLDVQIKHQDEHFLIVDKPAGLLVHTPHHLSEEPTVVDWLLAHEEEIGKVGYVDRPGIIHRLDKNTSGLLVICRTNYAHTKFGTMFREREIHKTYLALVKGHPPREGTIDLPIGRDPIHKTRMRTFASPEMYQDIRKRDAVTHYKVISYFEDCSLVEVKPVTGRTHQIRVHCASIGHPLIGDAVYGQASKKIDRHALHASELSFTFDGKDYVIHSEMPNDMRTLINSLTEVPSQK